MATFFSAFFGIVLGVLLFIDPSLEENLFIPPYLLEATFLLTLFASIHPWAMLFLFEKSYHKGLIHEVSKRAILHDRRLRLYSFLIQFISFLGFFILLLPVYSFVTLISSLILLGCIVDLFRAFFFRIQKQSMFPAMASWLMAYTRRSIKKQKEDAIIESFELAFSLFTACLKSGDISSQRVFATKVADIIYEILRAMPQITLFSSHIEESSLLDRYSLLEAMATKRANWAVKVAADTSDPTAFEEAVKLSGKLFLVFHSQHESLGFQIISSLSTAVLKREIKTGEWDKDVEVMFTFSEMVKSLMDRSVDKKISETSSILKVLRLLEWHVKESFQRDRTINPAFLMQPFAEIGQLFALGRYQNLYDKEMVLSDLKRILAQFSVLESVSQRLEVGEDQTDTKATYHEDLPFLKGTEKK